MVHIERTNTILYSDRFAESVAFYRDGLGLTVAFRNEWFVEFAIGESTFVSVADADRTSIAAGSGDGLTLSWQVPDVESVRAALRSNGVEVTATGSRWGAPVIDTFDPTGNRIEFWSSPVATHDRNGEPVG